VHQVNVTSDVSGRITDIMFTAGSDVKAGAPLVQLFERSGAGAISRASRRRRPVAQALARSRQSKLARAPVRGPQATGRSGAGPRSTRPQAGISKTEAIISQKLVRAPFRRRNSAVRHVEGRTVS